MVGFLPVTVKGKDDFKEGIRIFMLYVSLAEEGPGKVDFLVSRLEQQSGLGVEVAHGV